jgi:hypothetical protein
LDGHNDSVGFIATTSPPENSQKDCVKTITENQSRHAQAELTIPNELFMNALK